MDISEIQEFFSLPVQRHPWERARLEVITNLICNRLSIKREQKAIILDIGCGDTFVVEGLSHKLPLSYFIAVDIAFSNDLLIYYNERYKYNNIICCNSLDKVDLPTNGIVDIVLLLDVLEHIEEDIIFLNKILRSKYIGDHTKFIITVPSFQKLWSQHDVFLRHYRRYNASLLKTRILQAGFEISDYGYFFSILLFPRLIKVLFGRLFHSNKIKENGVGVWHSSYLIDRLATILLITDYKLSKLLLRIGIRLPGLSTYAICQKQL